MGPKDEPEAGDGAVNALTAESEVLELFYSLAALEPVRGVAAPPLAAFIPAAACSATEACCSILRCCFHAAQH
jgi:hypothetical protein